MAFTKSQQIAFDSYLAGEDFFLTGDAGTGKSYTVDQIIADATSKGLNVLAVAPTGKAAKNINGGTTIHSTFRVKLGIVDPDAVFYGKKDREGNNFLDMADLIIIDEISMVRYDLFGAVIRSIREAEKRSKKGKQIIVVGDFYQLPPVMNEKAEGDVYHKLYEERLFAFEHLDFKFRNVRLVEKVRTKDDSFMRILDRLRVGDGSVLDIFKVSKPSKTAVTLCSTNKETDRYNEKMLAKLKKKRTFLAWTEGEVTDDDKFAPERLEIAPGAHVLFTVNDSGHRWMNGTDGVIETCDENYITVLINGMQVDVERVTQNIARTELYTEKGADGKEKLKTRQVEVGKYTQFPFKLGWALTIHKSQGMTLKEVNIEPSKCFDHGQLYVAISRCTSLGGIHMLSKPLPEHLECRQVVKDFMESIEYSAENIAEDTQEYTANKCAGNIIGQDVLTNPNEAEINFITVADAEQIIADYGRKIMAKNSIEGKCEVRIITKEAESNSERKKEAKNMRQEALGDKIKQLDNPEVRKRLAAQDFNTQSVYHCIYDNNVDGICSLTSDSINQMVGISKRSVETGLQNLRNAGLIESVGARKTPKIHVIDVADTKSYETCLLYMTMAAKSGKNKLVCQECSHLDCPAHR